jgi:serine protease
MNRSADRRYEEDEKRHEVMSGRRSCQGTERWDWKDALMTISRFVLLSLLCFAWIPLAADPMKPLTPRRPADKYGPKLAPDTQIESIVIKFHEGTNVRLRGKSLVTVERDERARERIAALGLTDAQIENDLRAIQTVLASSKQAKGLQRLISIDEKVLADRRANGEARSGRELADFDLYYRVAVPSGATQAELDLLVETLNALSSVEVAYAQPHAQLAVDIPPMTPNFEPDQGYLDPAPIGIDARYAWTVPGGRGNATSIVDVEFAWRTTHEDLPPLFHTGGTQSTSLGYRNHGTAVLGVMVAPSNGYGVTGIVNQAWAGYESANTGPTADAITNASIAAGPSGIILIEIHFPGPSTPASSCGCSFYQCDFVPVEYFQANFDAIEAATANDTIVVEAGGNGATNLDDAVYGGLFNRNIRDSGAILVGASTPTDRVPTCFTNFGSRVDVHGWGEGVATLGYGYLFNANGDENQFYTGGFGGTSSASPIVTGAASSLIGVALAFGQPYGYRTSTEIRQILRDTGTPQAADVRQIGPLPNLREAILRVLDVRPTADFTISCTGFTCTADASASSDDVGIVIHSWDWGDGSGSTGGPTKLHTYGASGAYVVTLTVTDTIGQSDSTNRTVTAGPPPTIPGSFSATAVTGTRVDLAWTASTGGGGIAHYIVQRRQSRTGAWGPEQIANSTSYSDNTVTAAWTYQYRVKAVSTSQISSAFAEDYATTVVFGPDLQRNVTIIDGDHMRDLREAVDAWRRYAGGLPDVYPSNPVPAGVIKAANFITNTASDPLPGVVSALDGARNLIGLSPFSYSGVPSPAVNGIVYLEHVQQLRNAMK